MADKIQKKFETAFQTKSPVSLNKHVKVIHGKDKTVSIDLNSLPRGVKNGG